MLTMEHSCRLLAISTCWTSHKSTICTITADNCSTTKQFQGAASPESVYGAPSNEQVVGKKKSVSEPYQDNYNQESQYSNMRTGAVQRGQRYQIKHKSCTCYNQPYISARCSEPVPPSGTVKKHFVFRRSFDKVKKAIGNKQTYGDF